MRVCQRQRRRCGRSQRQRTHARDLCMDIGESVEAGQTSRGQHSDRLVVMLSAPGSQRTATPNPTPWPFCRSVSSPCAHTVASHIGVRVLLQFYPPPLTLSCSAQEARKQARTTSCPTSLSEEPPTYKAIGPHPPRRSRVTPRRARGAIETISAASTAMDFRLGLSSLQIASYLFQ